MEAAGFYNLTKKIISGIFAITIVLSLNSCATNVRFLASTVVPGAQGTVKVKKDNNQNYAISITLTDLAESEQLQPSKQSYIVWMDTDREITKNIGQLVSSKGFISKQRKGSFKTVSSDKPVRIFITAEDDAGTQYPGMQVVMSTDKFQP